MPPPAARPTLGVSLTAPGHRDGRCGGRAGAPGRAATGGRGNRDLVADRGRGCGLQVMISVSVLPETQLSRFWTRPVSDYR